MSADDDLKPGQLRLLDVDNQMVIPVNKKIRILTTSEDVIHSFFIPSFGVQRYAIPGRTIETWLEANQIGTFYGECNQICGTEPQPDADFRPRCVRCRFQDLGRAGQKSGLDGSASQNRIQVIAIGGLNECRRQSRLISGEK